MLVHTILCLPSNILQMCYNVNKSVETFGTLYFVTKDLPRIALSMLQGIRWYICNQKRALTNPIYILFMQSLSEMETTFSPLGIKIFWNRSAVWFSFLVRLVEVAMQTPKLAYIILLVFFNNLSNLILSMALTECPKLS